MLIIPMKLCVKMNLKAISTKELLRYHCCCHGNIVTIATVYVADACYPTLQLHKERLGTSYLFIMKFTYFCYKNLVKVDLIIF